MQTCKATLWSIIVLQAASTGTALMWVGTNLFNAESNESEAAFLSALSFSNPFLSHQGSAQMSNKALAIRTLTILSNEAHFAIGSLCQ